MPHELITTRTLTDIARHSNKVVRLSRFMAETQSPLLFEKMNYIEQSSDAYELMMALDADLGATANMLKSVALMVESLDDSHSSPELKAEESDFSKLFPSNYDKETRTLSLFGVSIPSNGHVSKVDNLTLKKMIFDQVFPDSKDKFSFDAYRKHISVLKSIEKSGRPKVDASFEDALRYANLTSSTSKWAPFYELALSMVGQFHKMRKDFSPKDRKLVDDKVYSGRAMIYGVVKSSTYISKESGVEQLYSKHNKEQDLVSRIRQLVNEIGCIKAVEIDKDTSLAKFHDILVDIKKMRLDVPDAFELKSRKLGNYKLCGVHAVMNGQDVSIVSEMGYSSEELRIIAVDLDSPAALAHEITHFRDRFNDGNRQLFVEHFTDKINRKMLEEVIPPSRVNYIFNDREVVARLGEIGFLLNQYDYQENESPNEFFDRVEVAEREKREDEDKVGYHVELIKPIERYLSLNNPINKEVYFNLSEWDPAELSMVKDYVHGFFFTPDPSIQKRLEERLQAGELDYQSRKFHSKNKKERVRRPYSEDEKVGMMFSKISPQDLVETYQVGVKEGIFGDGEFMYQLSKHHTRLGQKGGRGGKRSIELTGFEKQMNALLELSKSIDVKERPADALIFQDMASKAVENMGAITLDQVDPKLQAERFSRSFMLALMRQQTEAYWGRDSEAFKNLPSRDSLGRSAWVFRNKGPGTAAVEKIRNIGLSVASEIEKFNQAYEANPVKMSDAHEIAKWYWMQQDFSHFFTEEKALPGKVAAERQSMAGPLLMNHVLSLTTRDVVGKESVMKMAGFNKLPCGRDLMPFVQTHEMKLVGALLDKGWLDEFGLTTSQVKAFVDRLSSEMPAEHSSDGWRWEPGEFKFADAPMADNVKRFMQSISKHPAHEGELSGRRPRDYVVSELMSVHPSILRLQAGAMSPVTTLLNLTHQYTEKSWGEVSNYFKKESKAFLDSPKMRKVIEAEMPDLSEAYLSFRQAKKQAGGLTSASFQDPVVQYIDQLFFGVDLDNGDLKSKPTKMLASIVKEDMINDWLDFGRTGAELLRVQVSVDSVANKPMVIMKDDDCYKILKQVKMSETVGLAIEKLKEGTPENAWKPSKKSLPSSDVSEVERQFEEWVSRASVVSPELTQAILQGAVALSFNRAHIYPPNENNEQQSKACRDLVNASQTATAHWLISGELGGDCRKNVQAVVESVQQKETRPFHHKKAEVLANNNPELPKPNNDDIPAAEDKPLRPENQLRLI